MIGLEVKLKVGSTGIGKIIGCIPKGHIPASYVIEKYYGLSETDRDYKSVHRATKSNRWIIEKDNGHYLIVPDSKIGVDVEFVEN